MNKSWKSLIDLPEEKRNQLLLDAITDYAIYMMDSDGTVVTWNPGAERMKGYTSAEIVGRNFSTFFTEQDRRAGRPQHSLREAARWGRYQTEGWRVRKDGSRLCVFAIIDAVKAEDGKLIGFAKVTRDITERRASQVSLKDAQESLKDAREQLNQSQKMEAVGQLTGGIAHDFNNLLTVVLGNLDRIQRKLDRVRPEDTAEALAADLKRPLAMAGEGGRKAAQLTHRLLAFSRRQALEPRRLDANQLIFGLFEMMRRSLGETIDLRFEADVDLWPIRADANQLENVLLNLAVNARDAMPEGGKLTIATENRRIGPDTTIRRSELSEGDYVMITVTDTGEGIPPENIGRIFEPFFTTKETGKGSGLGLAMVHGFVKQSGGHVHVRSELGRSTTFELYLPRDTSNPAEMRKSRSAPDRAAQLSGNKSRGTVLLVEDNEGVRAHARSCLEEMGFSVVEAPDGPTALKMLREVNSVGLVFTDVVLPGGMSGRDVADRILHNNPGIPVLFTSGYTEDVIGTADGLDPSTYFLRKPYTQADLTRKIDELMSDAR